MDFAEKHYSIDPGEGKKMDGCPYSTFEDGRDVQDFIIPPKGYVFSGFRFDPNSSNQIYDGKLIAQYEKEAFNERLKSNLWKFILAFVIIVAIAVIALLAANVFKGPKTSQPKPKQPVTMVDTAVTQPQQETVAPVDSTPTAPAVSNETVAPTPTENQPEPAPAFADDPFRQAFWDLIHQRVIQMDPYHELFVNNKGKASGEEYDYLRFTILKDSHAFKEWTSKLKRIPDTELETISDINTLIQRINAY